MNKPVRTVLAVIAVFLAWQVLDMVLHGMILRPVYQATAELWRPEAEMKGGLMILVTLIAAGAFVGIYALLVGRKSVGSGILFGLLYGIATGVSMGFGTYAFMDVPCSLALGWFLGMTAQATLGGLVASLIVKE